MAKRIKRAKKPKCYFCENGSQPDYKETLILRRYISDRGKIVSSSRSGVCSSHQRMLSATIKRARFMALLPYTEQHAL